MGKHTLFVPTCYECGDRFTINRVNKTTNKYGKCDTCGLVDMCFECAIFISDNDEDGMECLMCHNNKQIEKQLDDKGIMKVDEGIWYKDNLGIKVFVGNSFLDKKIEITDIAVDESELNVKEVILDSSGNPVCAFGYCCEELYNRGALDDWENKWICGRCEYDLRKPEICGRRMRDGSICEEKVLYGYEHCGECMEIELGIRNEEDEYLFEWSEK